MLLLDAYWRIAAKMPVFELRWGAKRDRVAPKCQRKFIRGEFQAHKALKQLVLPGACGRGDKLRRLDLLADFSPCNQFLLDRDHGDDEPGKLFIPVNEAVDELGWQIARDDQGRTIQLNGSDVSPGTLRQLLDGTELVSTAQLAAAGATVADINPEGEVRVGGFFRGFTLRAGAQRVEVSLENQRLKGWQGDRLVIEPHD